VASLGGATLNRLRHRIGRAVHQNEAALEAGDAAVIRRLQLRSIGMDAVRGLLLTATALVLAWMAERWVRLDPGTATLLTVIAIGCGVAALIGGALRSAGRGAQRRWLVVGGAVGLALAWLL